VQKREKTNFYLNNSNDLTTTYGLGYVIGGSDTEVNESTDSAIQEISELSGVINIGLILPLSGDLATHGLENLEGSKLGVVEFNKHLEEIGSC